MRQIFRIFLLVAVLAMTAVSAGAQDKEKKQISREQLAEKQARNIARQLAFDDKTTARFVDVYGRCQREVWETVPRFKGGRGKSGGRMTDADSEQAIKQRMERSQKLLDIRKKYYEEYSKFLSQSQIQRVYEIEKQMMKRLAQRGQGRARRGR